MEHSYLVYTLDIKSCTLVGLDAKVSWENGAILLPVYKLAAQLREQLTGENADLQQKLNFPLMSVNQDSNFSVSAKKRHKEMG